MSDAIHLADRLLCAGAVVTQFRQITPARFVFAVFNAPYDLVGTLPECLAVPYIGVTDMYQDPFLVLHIGSSSLDLNGRHGQLRNLGNFLDYIYLTRVEKLLLVAPQSVSYSRFLEVLELALQSSVDQVVVLTPKCEAEFYANVKHASCLYRFYNAHQEREGYVPKAGAVPL